MEFEDFCYAIVRSVHGMLDEPTTRLLPSFNVPTLIMLPAAGHLSMIDKPKEFAAAVLSWLSEQERS